MPLGAFRINGLAKFTVTAVAEVIRRKIGVTAFGNAQVDTAQSKFGGASALFDGSGDYLRSYALPALGTNDFTIEFWARFNSTSNSFLLDARTSANGNFPTISYFSNLFYYVNGNNRITGSSLSTGVWYHIAVSRSGTSTKMFVDGTQVGSTYSDSTNYTATDYWTIAANGTDGGTAFNGHIDEFRVSKTARYTANFTPSTAPFQNDENTLLLLHMDGTDASTVFEDDNGVRSKKAITAFGNAQVDTAQSKFGGASAAFDGTGDYLLTAPSNYDLSGDFTIESWFYQNTTSTALKIFDGRGAESAQGGNGTLTLADVLMVDNAGGSVGGTYRIRFFVDGAERNSTSQSHANQVWHHMAMVRSGTTFTFYVNGISYGTYTQSPVKNYSAVMSDYFQVIGASFATGGFWNGWLDEIRISNTARYTANFTPSTTPFVNDDNTVLLIHCDGTDASTFFEDDNGGRAKLGISAIGNAQIDTAQSKFGGASAYFDGTGDYLTTDSNDLILGTGDFTIEGWFRWTDPSVIRGGFSLSSVAGGLEANNTNKVGMQSQSSKVKIYANDTVHTGTTTISSNTWYHIAVVRNSGTTKLYIDGTLELTATGTNKDYTGKYLAVGGVYSTAYLMLGHIDEFRVSNVARYTANFTAPTAPFQNDEDTLLLLHMDGTDGSTVFTDDNGVTPTHNYS